MDDLYKAIFSRNIGFFTEAEQDKLSRSTVAVAGMGGVGGLLAERLARLGVGHLKITDLGTFEQSNLNRQFGSSMLTLGQKKAEVVSAQVKDIDPQAQIWYSNTGVRTEADAALLVTDCDVVVDEMDFGSFRESVLLQRACRQRGIYYIFASAMGFGALVVIFDPEGVTLEEYNKFPLDTGAGGKEKLEVPLERIAPIIPSYAQAFPAEVIQEILAGKRPAPSTAIGTGLAAILVANEAANIILKKRRIAKAPEYTYIDLFDRTLVVGAVE